MRAAPLELEEPIPRWHTHLAASCTLIHVLLVGWQFSWIHPRTWLPFPLGLFVGLLGLPPSMVAQEEALGTPGKKNKAASRFRFGPRNWHSLTSTLFSYSMGPRNWHSLTFTLFYYSGNHGALPDIRGGATHPISQQEELQRVCGRVSSTTVLDTCRCFMKHPHSGPRELGPKKKLRGQSLAQTPICQEFSSATPWYCCLCIRFV